MLNYRLGGGGRRRRRGGGGGGGGGRGMWPNTSGVGCLTNIVAEESSEIKGVFGHAFVTVNRLCALLAQEIYTLNGR